MTERETRETMTRSKNEYPGEGKIAETGRRRDDLYRAHSLVVGVPRRSKAKDMARYYLMDKYRKIDYEDVTFDRVLKKLAAGADRTAVLVEAKVPIKAVRGVHKDRP
ncbi:hypothetical protein AKJ40_04235 [candidate division MSBL1 archaeon SCGC-AAA259M10]|uniref:Uncharacterized protein n=1 Tax=candidate division MSBL1 archaeon SCGC-AAA259M10 TaxID=1698270 RepID=A0A133UXR9_9EURY|nr:hypothetical protein AKJ40_04235 [candidate division MSBL1 archaeon SCGC-AAA259M10]